ncbi:MAG TPA: hypothetical protein VMX18_00950 [Candidatus Bipolaricaulota bacterium]|nr:hypothetical protein [Candidatus Bipolaricaulota bacterium]
MHETINQPIEVIAAFTKNKIIPLFFKWRDKRYKIRKINLVHSASRGKNKLYFFSVNDAANYFKLCFDTGKGAWQLLELYYEG